jgi:pimeloyl-ACP methyl ester carboxylesterase
MKQIEIDDARLDFEISGAGPPVLLIHGANLADGLLPIARHPMMTSRFQLIRYHRRGMSGSTGGGGPISVERQAQDAVQLLTGLGVDRAHVVGYSYGATVALETAASAPGSVLSLSLLEPILPQVPVADEFMQQLAPVFERYGAGDVPGALALTFEGLGGPHWRSALDAAVPGGFDQAVVDAPVYFEAEAPSLGNWNFDVQRLAAVRCPVLSVLGGGSGPFFAQGRNLLHRWFPQCADVVIDGVGHLLHMQEPEAVVDAVAAFLQSVSSDS